MVTLFDKIKMRKTYIGHFEMIAAIVPFLTLPAEWFKHQDVELWIDNSQALGCFIKGYAGTFDCAKLVTFSSLRLLAYNFAPFSSIMFLPSRTYRTSLPALTSLLKTETRNAGLLWGISSNQSSHH